MTIFKNDLHIFKVNCTSQSLGDRELLMAVMPVAKSNNEPMDIQRDLVHRIPDGYSDDDIYYYFDSYEEFEKFQKRRNYLEDITEVLSVENVYFSESLTGDHIRFKREKYFNDMMYRYTMRVIKDVSNLEQDIRKTVPSMKWNDTMATLENHLFGLLDGYLYSSVKREIDALLQWVIDNRDEVTPIQVRKMQDVMYDVTVIYNTMEKILIPTENL